MDILNFIHKFFSDFTFFKACSSGNTIGFSNFTKHNVPIIGLGIFHSSESAYQALKDQTNIDYVWMTVVFSSIAAFLQYWWITNLLEITAEEGRVPQQTVTEDGEEEYYYDNAYDAVN